MNRQETFEPFSPCPCLVWSASDCLFRPLIRGELSGAQAAMISEPRADDLQCVSLRVAHEGNSTVPCHVGMRNVVQLAVAE